MATMRRITKEFRKRASVDEVRELLEVQEMEGLHLRLAIWSNALVGVSSAEASSKGPSSFQM